MLREVACGEHDWTQGYAIELMCRLAAEGIDRDRTLTDLKREMPGMRKTALFMLQVRCSRRRSRRCRTGRP
jgi:hypothetical protein